MNMWILILLALTLAAEAKQSCPVKYSRFSTEHSYCLEPNKKCEILYKGTKSGDRKAILKAHNEYRSKVALGKEKEAGGLPKASDMMEMAWDNELEEIAQRWASQCAFKHDCKECRYVENFSVGQNLAQEVILCPASDKICLERHKKPNWTKMIDAFYDEVKLFKNQLVTNYNFDKSFGHFSQVVWADTWKVGCGYVVFKRGYYLRKLYACNYGPAGNVERKMMYQAGKPCSECPSNTCCGNCKTSSYPGLCKVTNIKQGPVYESSIENPLIDCNWRNGTATCKFKVYEQKKWSLKQALGGNYYSIQLKGGEKSTLKFMTPIESKSGSFCLHVGYRKTPTNASSMDSSELILNLEADNISPKDIPLRSPLAAKGFGGFYMDIHLPLKTKVTAKIVLKFSVPPGAPDHILDLKEVTAYGGQCKIKEVARY